MRRVAKFLTHLRNRSGMWLRCFLDRWIASDLNQGRLGRIESPKRIVAPSGWCFRGKGLDHQSQDSNVEPERSPGSSVRPCRELTLTNPFCCLLLKTNQMGLIKREGFEIIQVVQVFDQAETGWFGELIQEFIHEPIRKWVNWGIGHSRGVGMCGCVCSGLGWAWTGEVRVERGHFFEGGLQESKWCRWQVL